MQRNLFLKLLTLFIASGILMMFSACESTTTDPTVVSNTHPVLVNACSLLTTSEVVAIF